jgi:hypothetical protein
VAFTFWFSKHPRPSGANLQLAGENDMKPPEDLKPEGMLDWVKEQIPWLKNPNNAIPHQT